MATSTLMKFSLLTIIVVLSSYISFTEAVTHCPVSSNASSTDIMTAYNCTAAKCTAAHAACTGSNCVKVTPLLQYIKVQLFLVIKTYIGTCAPCSPSHIISVNVILALIALLITLLLALIQQLIITLLNCLSISVMLSVQLSACIAAVGTSAGATLVINALNVMITLGLNIMLSCIT